MEKDTKSPATPKHHRHVSIVGGTSAAPSLREVAHHRNYQRKMANRRSQSAKASSAATTPSSSAREKRSVSTVEGKREALCNLCQKVQRQWNESSGLRKKTSLSDITLHSSDGEYFYCNSFVISLWSKSLLDGARSVKATNGQEEWIANVEVFSGEVLEWSLFLMHGGAIEQLPPKQLLEIVKMADTYQMEEIKRLCFSAADVVPLKIDNVCAMWLFASEHDLSNAVDRAMRFAYSELDKVVEDRDWARISHRPDLLLNLFEASVKWTMAVDWRSVSKDAGQFALGNGVQSIWRESSFLRQPYAHSDAVIKTKGGGTFHVHTQIIYATSPKFAAFLYAEIEANDSNEVFMDDMDDDVIEEFLRFFYQQEPSSSFPKLASFVNILATDYDLIELERLCQREMAVFQLKSVDAALELLREAEEHRLAAAKSICFRYLYNNLDEMRENKSWNSLIKDEPQLLTEMMLESRRFRRVVDAGKKYNE